MTPACQSTIDGVPTHGSRFPLTEVLRGEPGFTGVLIAEGGDLTTLVTEGLAENQRQAGAPPLAAGVDVGITWEDAYLDELSAAVRDGDVPERLVDRSVGRVLNLKSRLACSTGPAPTRTTPRRPCTARPTRRCRCTPRASRSCC